MAETLHSMDARPRGGASLTFIGTKPGQRTTDPFVAEKQVRTLSDMRGRDWDAFGCRWNALRPSSWRQVAAPIRRRSPFSIDL